MKKKFCTIFLIMFFLTLLVLIPNCLATDSSTIIEFKDEAIKEYFLNGTYSKREYNENGGYSESYGFPMDENGDGEITVEEMAKIETIYLSECTTTDYSFFQYCENLRILQISYEEVEDISFLENLSTLEKLYLMQNNISDITPLKNLTNLEELYLGSNNISDASAISGLVNLRILDINNNNLNAIPDLSKITAFNNIEIYNYYGKFKISVNFMGNQITDISGLKNTILGTISLYDNRVSDLSVLATMTNLTSLDISNNEVSDISSIPTTVTGLQMANNKITDISHLENLTNLQYVYASNNQITDASVLSKLTNLAYIDLNYNRLKELSLSDSEKIQSISCSNNELEKVTLKNLTNMYSLSLNNNNISDLSNISGLDKISGLSLSTNPISDISPISSTVAKNIYLVDTLVNPYDEATFHIMCTWQESGQNLHLGDYSQFKPSNEKNFTTEEIKEVTIGEEKVTVMPIDKKTNVKDILTEESFPVINTYTIKVLDTNGKEKDSTAKVGSRNIIQIIDESGELLAEYTVVVPGDVNGDGETRIYDSFQILKDVLITLEENIDAIEIMIRDFNNDGNIRIYDAFQYLKEAILG